MGRRVGEHPAADGFSHRLIDRRGGCGPRQRTEPAPVGALTHLY